MITWPFLPCAVCRERVRDRVNPPFAARCFQFLSKIEQFCVSIKSQNYFALFSSMSPSFQENINANLTFAVNAIPNLSYEEFLLPVTPVICNFKEDRANYLTNVTANHLWTRYHGEHRVETACSHGCHALLSAEPLPRGERDKRPVLIQCPSQLLQLLSYFALFTKYIHTKYIGSLQKIIYNIIRPETT